jgi:hypothetical protein
MQKPLRPPTALRVPALIKRNTALFALSQSFTGAGMQLGYGIGPLMVIGGRQKAPTRLAIVSNCAAQATCRS